MSRVTALPALRNRRTAAGSGRIAIFTNSSHTAPDFPNLFITFAVDISKGCPYYQAEIIPIEPDTGNAETGMHNLSTHTPFQFINF